MDSFEFLGGRYSRPEQIMSGPVQAFRAQNAANGRNVFIHRVSTTEAAAEQASLLKLMTTALVKSADAKRLVLDFGEEQGFWYVVTENEPQCALLREWLQLEIDAAGSRNSGAAPPAPAPPSAPTPTRVSSPEQTDPGEFTRFLQARPPLTSTSRAFPPQRPSSAPLPPSPPPPPVQRPPSDPLLAAKPPVASAPHADPSEFSMIFRPNTKLPENDAPAFNPQPQRPEPQRPMPPPVAPVPPSDSAVSSSRPAPGEFTGYFNPNPQAGGRPRQPQPQRPTSAPPPFAPPQPPAPKPPQSQTAPPALPPDTKQSAQPEPGEFTRYFNSGLPVPPPKPAPAPQNLNFERAQNNPHVQRPTTPVNLPPPPPKPAGPAEPGEFTQMFARPDTPKTPAQPPAAYRSSPPVRSDPMGFAQPPSGPADNLSDQLFSDRIDVPNPIPSSQPKQGDFTRMFGSKGAASPPLPPQAVVAPPREKPLLDEDPFKRTQPMSLPPQSSRTPAAGEPPAHTPSEFTVIMQGGYGAAKPPAGPTANGAPLPKPAPGGGAPLMSANISGANPASLLPHLGGAAGSMGSAHAQASSSSASASSPVGSAHLQGPHLPGAQMKAPSASLKIPAPSVAGANKKMIILFAAIGVAAVFLILLMLFLMKNK